MAKLSRDELANLAIGLPIATAIIGGLAGIGLGFAFGWVVKPNAGPSDEQVARMTLNAFSPDQIDFKCGQIKGEELANANERIAALVQERELYEKKVLELEATLATKTEAAPKGGGSGSVPGMSRDQAAELNARAAEFEARARVLADELEMARNQLATVTRQLTEARDEKRIIEEALVRTATMLADTEQKLEVQVTKTQFAENDAMQQKWWRFLADAQLSVCEKGNRKKLGACRETVQARLSERTTQQRVIHCVRSKQATPTVNELEKDAKLPRYAVYIDQENKVTKDWYIQLCDPTLPEASGLDSPMPTSTRAGGRDLELDLNGIEDLD